MKECDNSKIHISSNSLFSICHLIQLDNLLLGTINTLKHFATFHPTTLHYKYQQLNETFHFMTLSLFQRLFKGPLKPSGRWTS